MVCRSFAVWVEGNGLTFSALWHVEIFAGGLREVD